MSDASRGRFLCDEMLAGLARWIRAAGHDAVVISPGLGDGALVAEAAQSRRVLLSSDGGIFERNVVRDGRVRAIFVPHARPLVEQLAFVLGKCGLRKNAPRCMACGGELRDVEKASVKDEAPARSFEHCDRFWRCAGCGKLFWNGSHWLEIERALAGVP